MSIGGSGRIVIEIAPDLKRELHAALSHEGRTLKSWFVVHAEEYIRNSKQLSMFDNQQENAANQTNSSKG